jgi:hypothetical protein
MSRTATYPTTRLAAALLDLIPVADDTLALALRNDPRRAITRDAARSAVLGEALAFWQDETDGATLTPEFVTEILDDMRSAIDEHAIGLVLDAAQD